MIQAAKGIGITLAAFALAFGLHIIGAATNQGWLFAVAVGLIFAISTGFPAIALWVSGLAYKGSEAAQFTYRFGVIIGTGLTLGALWATNDRAFTAWHFPVSILSVAVVSAFVLLARSKVDGSESPAGSAIS